VSGAPPPAASPPSLHPGLPPLVLRCRPWLRNLWIALALGLLAVGTAILARPADHAEVPPTVLLCGVAALLAGALSASYAGRYCLSRLVLDETGFRLEGFLVHRGVRWSEVVEWRRFPAASGPVANALVVYGTERRRLCVPLIYEESQALEVGLAQRGFPRY